MAVWRRNTSYDFILSLTRRWRNRFSTGCLRRGGHCQEQGERKCYLVSESDLVARILDAENNDEIEIWYLFCTFECVPYFFSECFLFLCVKVARIKSIINKYGLLDWTLELRLMPMFLLLLCLLPVFSVTIPSLTHNVNSLRWVALVCDG